jgi:hypothetical protein
VLWNFVAFGHLPVVMDDNIPDPRVTENISPQRVLVKRGAVDDFGQVFIHLVQEVIALDIG